MGREIRMVPLNWSHPKKEKYDYFKGITYLVYQPMYDKEYYKAALEWSKRHE